jgi:uncharacterized protein (TIGR02118 family)
MSDKHDTMETALFGRRSALTLGAISAAALVANMGRAARAQSGTGVKLTVLYTKQKDPEAFTKYYLSTHMPMVAKVPGVKRTEAATVLPPPPDQPAPMYYRITDVYFEDIGAMQKTLATPEWKAVVADVPNFCDPGTISAFASLIGT